MNATAKMLLARKNARAPPSANSEPLARRLRTEGPQTTGSSSETAMQRRSVQVAQLSTGVKLQRTARGLWPAPSAKTLSLFQERHEAFKTFSTGYMQTQERLLFLMDVHPDERFARFEEECFSRTLAPTTAHSYWISFTCVNKILGDKLGQTPAVSRCSKLLEARILQYPVAFPKPLSVKHRRTLRSLATPSTVAIHLLIEVCWSLGQRFGDFLQIAVNDVIVRHDVVLITFKRGKTVTYTKPYTLSVDRHVPLIEEFLNLRQTAIGRGWNFIASKDNAKADCSSLKHHAASALALVDEQLELRSIRRGGLQHMAKLRMTLSEIRLFSQHASDKMLLRYLNWGTVAVEQNDRIRNLTSKMFREF